MQDELTINGFNIGSHVKPHFKLDFLYNFNTNTIWKIDPNGHTIDLITFIPEYLQQDLQGQKQQLWDVMVPRNQTKEQNTDYTEYQERQAQIYVDSFFDQDSKKDENQ